MWSRGRASLCGCKHRLYGTGLEFRGLASARQTCLTCIPAILSHFQIKNPYPNVDAHSGVLLQVCPAGSRAHAGTSGQTCLLAAQQAALRMSPVPWPFVQHESASLIVLPALQYYGITEERFYTVLFGVSRALGVLSQVRRSWGGAWNALQHVRWAATAGSRVGALHWRIVPAAVCLMRLLLSESNLMLPSAAGNLEPHPGPADRWAACAGGGVV